MVVSHVRHTLVVTNPAAAGLLLHGLIDILGSSGNGLGRSLDSTR